MSLVTRGLGRRGAQGVGAIVMAGMGIRVSLPVKSRDNDYFSAGDDGRAQRIHQQNSAIITMLMGLAAQGAFE